MAFLFLIAPATTLGNDNDMTFVPSLTGAAGDLSLGVRHQTFETIQGDKRVSASSTRMEESLNLSAIGFVYHPRFAVFDTSLSELQSQDSTLKERSDATSYSLRILFLPEHPYNLELHKRHTQAYTANTPGIYNRGTVDEEGVRFTFKMKPLVFNTSYVSSSITNNGHRTDSNAYHGSGGYSAPAFAALLTYTHTDATSSALNVTSEERTFFNSIHLWEARLDSRAISETRNQTRPNNPDFQTETFHWTERLTSPLPWNFDTTLSYQYGDNVSRSGAARETSSQVTDRMFNLSHHLYKSLDTNYTRNEFVSTFSDGKMEGRTDTLGSVYTKMIPVGRLTVGVQFGNSEMDRTGTPTIIDERHSAVLPPVGSGTFLLDQQNVRADSILIRVVDLATGGLIDLPQSNYVVSNLGNSIQIMVFSVSPATSGPPDQSYVFSVSYSLLLQSSVKTTSSGYSLALNFLDNLLSAYYRHFTTVQDVTSGSLAGGGDRTISQAIGLTVSAEPYSGLIEFQNFESQIDPYRTRLTAADYRKSLDADTDLTAHLGFTQTDHLASMRGPNKRAYQERRMDTSVIMSIRFPEKDLTLNLDSRYYRTESTADSNALLTDASVSWRIGLLTFSAGAQLDRMETGGDGTKKVDTTEYYYLTMTRKLF